HQSQPAPRRAARDDLAVDGPALAGCAPASAAVTAPPRMIELPVFTATRYVQPLREGGSLPAVVESSSGDLLVVKFRGAGQGAKALVAELIVGLLARALGLPTPELAIVDVPPPFGR